MLHSISVTIFGHQGSLNRYAFLKKASLLFITIVAIFSHPKLNAQVCSTPTLVCNDQVNISIPNGTITLSPDMVSNAIPSICIGDYTVEIIENGFSQGNQVSCTESGQILEYKLSHTPSGLYCTGTILIEDKSGPEIFCEDINIPCSEDSSVENLGSPIVTDNCDDNPSLFHTDNFIDYNCTNPDFLATIERTWLATDNMANSSTCVQQINIIRPSLNGLTFPDDITISCNDGDISPSNTGGPSISNMLSGTACNFIVYFEDTETIVCTGSKKVIRKWFVTDWCTGNEVTDTQIIFINDTQGPMINCPANLVFSTNESECTATINLPIATATDNCSNVISVEPSWEFGSGNIEYTNVPQGEYTLEYIATDDCGNASACLVQVSVIDDVIPVAICDLATTVGIGESQTSMICASDLDSGSSDNCELVTREIRLVSTDDYSECIPLTCEQVGQILTVELQVTDVNGLQNHCTVEVSVFDKAPPVITSCAEDITISCDEDASDLNLTGETLATDNCSVEVSFTDVSDLNECNVGTIIRTFIATDGSGNNTTCEQTITLEDNTAPVIQFSEDLTLVCVDNNDDIGRPTVEDNCGKFAFNFIDRFSNVGDCIETFTRTWEVLDLCTDETYSEDLKVTLLNDSNIPVFTGAPTDITAECNAPVPDFITPTITDLCDSDLDVEIVDAEEPGLCPNTRVLTRTFIATDDCGNSNSFMQTITFIDNIGPTFTSFPDDQTINCDETIIDELPEAIDNCDTNPSITFVNDTIPGECNNEILIVRTFTVSDFCGNANTGVQLIRFVDDLPPIIRGQTNDITIPCDFQIPVFDLGAIDNCDDDLTIEILDTSTPGDCPNEELVSRLYTVIDDCGNSATAIVNVTLVDNRAPTLTASNLVENITIECDQALPVINFSVSDNCDEDVMVVETIDSNGDPCILNLVRTFTAADACGNASTLTQNVTIIDEEPPFFASFPQDQDVTIFSGESIQVDVIDAIPIDVCSPDTPVDFVIDFFDDGDQPDVPNVSVDGNNASGVYPLGKHRVTFNTSDACGNTNTQDLLITVVDFSPSNICTSVTLEIGENGLLLLQPSNVIEDQSVLTDPNITGIQFVNPSNFTQVIGSEILLTCEDIGLTQFAIEIITDAGESTICSNMVNLIDPDTRCGDPPSEASVAGKIFNLEGKTMKNIEIQLDQDMVAKKYTDQHGVYSFESIPMGSSCSIQPQHDVNPAKGISTFDMVLIMQHILDINPLSNPYQHIAADVDLSGSIDLFDLLEIRNLILYRTDRFSNSPSYTFIEKDYVFSNPDSPLSESIPDLHLCPSLEENIVDLDFYMIKMGDIDGTVFENLRPDVEERNVSNIELQFEDRLLPANKESVVKISMDNVQAAAAIQFSLEFKNANLVDYYMNEQLDGYFHQKNNRLYFAWTKFDNTITDGILELKITPSKDVNISELIALSKEDNSSSYTDDGYASPISLTALQSQVSDVAESIILAQNTPNPFSDYTVIDFYLTTDEPSTFSVLNMAGQVVWQQEGDFSKGWNSIRFTADQVIPGVYIYSISQGKNIQIKKMLIAK